MPKPREVKWLFQGPNTRWRNEKTKRESHSTCACLCSVGCLLVHCVSVTKHVCVYPWAPGYQSLHSSPPIPQLPVWEFTKTTCSLQSTFTFSFLPLWKLPLLPQFQEAFSTFYKANSIFKHQVSPHKCCEPFASIPLPQSMATPTPLVFPWASHLLENLAHTSSQCLVHCCAFYACPCCT